MPYITATHNTVLKQKVLPSKVLKEEYPDSFLGIRKGAEIGVISVSGGWEGHKWVKLAGPLSGEESGWIYPGHFDGLEGVPAGGMPPSHSGGGSNSGNGPNQAGEWTSQAPFQFDYQDTSYTCQSSSIQIVTNGEAREMQVRARLKQLGNPGDPYIIGQVLREYVGDRYEYNGQASVNQMIDYIKRGASLILQASVTEAGHVFPAVGCDDKADQLVKEFPGDELLHDGPKVIDPWTKYNWHKLVYDGTSMGYEGYYPWYGIYASAVKAYSFFQFQQVWGGKVPEGWKDEGGAYCHIIWPKK